MIIKLLFIVIIISMNEQNNQLNKMICWNHGAIFIDIASMASINVPMCQCCFGPCMLKTSCTTSNPRHQFWVFPNRKRVWICNYILCLKIMWQLIILWRTDVHLVFLGKYWMSILSVGRSNHIYIYPIYVYSWCRKWVQLVQGSRGS